MSYVLEDPHEKHPRVTEAFLCKYLYYYYVQWLDLERKTTHIKFNGSNGYVTYILVHLSSINKGP